MKYSLKQFCLFIVLSHLILSRPNFECNAFSPNPFSQSRLLNLSERNLNEKNADISIEEEVSLCIIGGGVSGLSAAITAAKGMQSKEDNYESKKSERILLLEKSMTLGGRVQSDKTSDGYTLDRGFAVFIEEYPFSKELLNYDELNLGKFLPGAFVKTSVDGKNKNYGPLHKVADPLRIPSDLFTAILAPIGTYVDKIKAVRLLYNVFTNTIEELFEQEETDTLSCLKDKYGFSDKFIGEFFEPFLEGIYLAPLKEQSSRMFHFVFKMFAEGSATLPEGGMGKIIDQLESKAKAVNIEICNGDGLSSIQLPSLTQNDKHFTIVTSNDKTIKAKSVILATEGPTTQKILSTLPGFESLDTSPEQVQRSVGCIYYGFKTSLPVSEPILILNGARRSPVSLYPVNNVCFPSTVTTGYAPDGYNLCSVTILEPAMRAFAGKDEELDATVRNQLKAWFPNHTKDIESSWEMKGLYNIANAQPGQLSGPLPANVNGGRECSSYRSLFLPKGLFLCGDHMSTATLNGALESGVNAGLKSTLFLL